MNPSPSLMVRMMESAEWHQAKGHLEAMLEFAYFDSMAPESSAEHERRIKWEEMYDKAKTFMIYMDDYVF